jgi:K+-sensing histidine kinase KdpD
MTFTLHIAFTCCKNDGAMWPKVPHTGKQQLCINRWRCFGRHCSNNPQHGQKQHHNHTCHMTTIIENLLTIARTQQRLATVPRYDLTAHIKATILTTQQHAPHRRIISDCPEVSFFCTSDPNYVTHILRILIDNAIVHTPDTSTISVQLQMAAGHCELLVCDDGHGIPANQVSQIFEPFVSIDRGTKHRGSGIGLSIAQSFCNAINATIHYHPNQPHGACFVVRLAE